MLGLNDTLSYYKREDIREAIVQHAADREVAIKYGGGFGKRPDMLKYPNDILELVRQGATSFHASEERWKNPYQLDPGMKKKEIERLRTGWDLVIDIDCEVWELSKITAWLIVKSLKEHGINSVTAKFSGNKGFHVGVPFEAFPKKIVEKETRLLFPDAPRKIALYLLDYIKRNYIKVDSKKVVFENRFEFNIEELSKKFGKDKDKLMEWYCENCKGLVKKEEGKQEEIVIGSSDVDFMNEMHYRKKIEKKISKKITECCKNPSPIRLFNPETILNIDTLLISPRHLYRMPYSMHEKSGLVSVPINPDLILAFEKEKAKPENVKVEYGFLDRKYAKPGEANKLLLQALDFEIRKEESGEDGAKEYYEVSKAIPEKFFPPCIKIILSGLEDGRKRSLFILVNFLTSAGWGYKEIEKLLEKWNEKNYEPLRNNLIVGQIRYHKGQKKNILPPNCDNMVYYKGFGVCKPDALCQKIKNPVNYSIRKTRYLNDK